MMSSRSPRRDRQALVHLRALADLRAQATPGFEPRVVEEPACPSGKRRWPSEHRALAALHRIRRERLRRARGEHLGSLETRCYACERCGGWHLTSWSEPPEWQSDALVGRDAG